MSTSLAEQLQRLALPQTAALKRDKKRASLLFDPKEAAGLRKETVYQIGLEGLEELIQKNEIFGEFQNTLFHITSKDFERSVQNAEANEYLDKNIRKFLLFLSPHFLLNCCYKALEWLIYRYSIHEYNREDLLMLILPYHECNIFVRTLQLLQFKDNKDNFYFLKALQKPGVHLTKNALLNHAASDSGFIKFVTRYILLLIEHHNRPDFLTVAFNFYCSVFTGVIEYSKEVTEDQISQMLPLLLKGLNSPIPDFCAATYVITARLVARSNLSNKLLDKFVEKLSEVKVAQLKTEACLVLLVIYQSQEQYLSIPTIAVSNLSEKEWLPKVLQNLNNSGSFILPFFEKFIRRCTEEGTTNDLILPRDIIKKCLEHIKLEDSYVTLFLNSVLDSIKLKKYKKYSTKAKEWLIDVMQTLERQYPAVFDKEVSQILSAKYDKKKKCLSKILKNTMAYKGKFEVFEKLYHPNPQFRSEAVRYLLDNYTSLKETDRELIKTFLLDRLNDENVGVVEETLAVIKKVSVINIEDSVNTLIIVLNKCSKEKHKWANVYKCIIGMLCTNCNPTAWEVFLAVFPALLPKTVKELKFAKEIMKTPFLCQNVLLKGSVDNLESVEDVESFEKQVFELLESNTTWDVVKEFLEVLNTIPNERKYFHKYVVTLLLSHILPEKSSFEVSTLVLEVLNAFYIINTRQKFKKNVYTDKYLTCLENIIKKTENPDMNLGLTDFSTNTAEKNYFVLLANILVRYNSYREVLNTFIDSICENLHAKVNFLLNLCVSENKNLKKYFKKKCLTYLLQILKGKDEEIKHFIYIDEPTVPYLLLLLSNTNEDIRKLTFSILDLLIKASTRKSGSYFYLLEGLNKHREEITIDPEQVALVIFNILDSSNTKGKKHAGDLNSIRSHLLKLACNNDTPIYLKAGILSLLSHINTFDILEKTSEVALTLLRQNPGTVDKFNAIIIGNVINRFEEKVMSKLNSDTNTWQFLELAIKNYNTTVVNNTGDEICLTALLLNQFEKEMFGVLEEKVVKSFLDLLIEIASVAHNPEVLPAASRIFKHIDLDATLILEQLVEMSNVQSPKQDTNKKKRRVSVIPTVDILDTLEWKKGVTVLEFIQDKKKIRNTSNLLPVLFGILKKCLDFDEQAAVEYPKQLVLSSILHCCSKMEGEPLPENVFNVELIVQCIRASQNPQTHHHALLVLAHTAHLIPTQVLHHMMAIFTFMGSSVLRHDDAYSFQIITKIVDTIIPILVKDDDINSIAMVLRVFVDALLDVPEHRKMPLYKQLLTRLDAEENLYLFLLLVFESQVLHSSQDKHDKDNAMKKFDIAANFCREFSPKIVIHSCIKLIKYLQELPDERNESPPNINTDTFTIITHTPKDFRHFKYLLLKFTASLLASPEFVIQVATLTDKEELSLEGLFKEMIVNILQYIQRVSKVAEKSANTPQNHYWKVVLHHSYDILDGINALITPQMFLLVTKGLMVHTLNTIKRRIMELLNTKLQYNPQFFADCEKNEIYALIPPIISIIERIDDEIEPDLETVVQTALLSLKLLTKSLAQEDPEKFVQILEFITNLIKSGKAQNNVLASLLLCLAELCVNLRAHAIAGLSEFMPAVIKVLKQQKYEEVPSVLLRSIITTIEKILDSMPLFLSPYLEKLLVEVSLLICKWAKYTEDQKLQPFVNKLSSIKHKIGSMVPSRVLIPAIEQCYNKLVEKKCFGAVGALMDILSESMSVLRDADINSNLPELTNFFLTALKFRSDEDCSLEEANSVEGHIVQALTVLILKLSESTFRPLYYKIFDWAVRSEIKNERIITFYSLSSRIAQSLKSLFVLFAGHFLNNAAQILDACNIIKNDTSYFEGTAKNILLLENVLKTLNAVFMYDNQKFINKEKFDVLMQALVDQLENDLGGIDALVKRNEELLTPCLVNFSLATADDALWKQMNYQILLKMRHNSPQNRLVALHCLTEIVKKLGEDFLPLLPETIPFLAELLEDEEESVEKACQKAVQEMEKVLGEPLQKYF